MKKIVLSFSVPEFVEAQRESFLKLLKEGIPTELNKRNPLVIILNKADLKKRKEEKKKQYRLYRKYIPKKMNCCHIIFHGNYYKLMRPQKTIRDAVLTGNTYSARLFVPVEIKLFKSSKLEQVFERKWIFLGNLPLMTTRGHFIINGSPRVILHQIVRSPGVYYHEVIDIYRNKRKVYADLICHRGVWLRMEIDHKGLIWVKMKKYPKIPVVRFLQSFGLEHPHFLAQLSQPIISNKLILLAKRDKLEYEKSLFVNINNFIGDYFQKITDKEKTELVSSPTFLNIFKKIKTRYQKKRPSQRYRWGLEPTDEILKIWMETKKVQFNKNKKVPLLPSIFSLFEINKLKPLDKIQLLENQISLMYQLKITQDYQVNDKTPWKARKKKGTILSKAKKIFKSKMRAQLALSKFITLEEFPYSINERDFITTYRWWKHGIPGSNQWLKKNRNLFPTLCDIYKDYDRIPNAYLQLINYSQFLRYDNWKKEQTFLNKSKGKDETKIFEYFDEFFEYFQKASESRAKQFLIKTFLKPKAYDLGNIGRIQMNRKFGLNKSLNQLTLTLDDFICMINYLREVKSADMPADDIDHLKNRRVRTSGELIQNQIGIGLIRLARFSKQKDLTAKSQKKLLKEIRNCLSSKHLERALKEFFHSSPLSQFMDETNPLAEITHKRRLSSLGPGGITRETAGLKIRSIHPSHYGRICPIETPEGPNAGLVNSLTTYARINNDGFLETPFYKVFEGQIQKNNDHVVFLSASQGEIENIAAADLPINSLNNFVATEIPIMLNNEFSNVLQNEVDFMSISRIQMISIATSLIPFLEHDDANRALMGSNMQRQSVPLLNPERPIVGTGLEGRVLSDSSQAIQAKYSGIVTYASSQKIQIFSFIKTKEPTLKFKGILTNYFLKNFEKSNQNTCIAQRPLVHEGEWIEKGSCLTDSSSTANGELAIGKNILVAYLPWEGYNFEDAILISERLIYDHLFTSIHINKYVIDIRETELGQEQITKEVFPWELKLNVNNLDSNGIVKVGTWVTEGDILVRKITPIDQKKISNYQKFVYIVAELPIPHIKDTSLRAPKGVHGRVISIKMRKTRNTLLTKPIGPEAVVIWIAEKKAIQVGDKMSGRHGNKGIVSRILAREDMPYLQDGTPVDMVLNPLGVPSRMNVGQIYEALLGLAGTHLKQNYKVTPFDEISGYQASRSLVFSKLSEAKRKTGKKWLFQAQNPGKMRVFDGRTGQVFDQPVTVGQPYILKLIHMVDDKIHARATGPYSLVTQQPLRGRAKKGGQRFGEMEVWALEGFGAAYTLQEILTIKSDDIQGRKQVTDACFYKKKIRIGRPESFRVLIRELQALCLQVNMFEFKKIKPVDRTRVEMKSPYKRIEIDSPKFNCYELIRSKNGKKTRTRKGK